MKRKIVVLMLALLVLSLAGCGHEHTWNDATCTEPKTCSECGETEGKPLGHDFADATCTEPKTCKECGETEGAPAGHSFADATCAAPKTCTVCGETEGEPLEHSFADATCTEPRTCTLCGETDGEPLGHQLSEATYVTPATCSVCGETEGDVLPPDFETYNLPLVPLGETREVTVACWDDATKTTVGKVTFTDYQTFDSDETHEAKDGYEWKVVTATAYFDDENANAYGMRYNTCYEDYYDIRFHDETASSDEEAGTHTYYVHCKDEDLPYTIKYSSDNNGGWTNRTITFTSVFELQVPKGYDGCVVGIINSGIDWPEGKYIFDVFDPETFVLFRLD